MTKMKRWKAEAAKLPPEQQITFWLEKHDESARKAMFWGCVSVTFMFITLAIKVFL